MLMRRFCRHTSGVLGLMLVLAMVLLSFCAGLLTHVDPTEIDTGAILRPPSAGHPFGQDDLGRDVFARVLYGGRISINVGLAVTGLTFMLGTVIGLTSGYYPKLDTLIMRAMDLLMAFPPILLALAVVAMLGPQLVNIIIALVVTYTPTTARIVRATVLQLKQKEFIEAARCMGAGDRRILVRHLLPNTMAPVLVQQTYILALAILTEASLNFLGVGVPPEVPTLGGIVSDARTNLRYAPWLPLFPGAAISMLVLGFNLLGDALRDVLDPRMKI
jgi:peptide/nickel transport system permease protein